MTIRVYDPSVEITGVEGIRKAAPESFALLRLAVLNNGWRSMDLMSRMFATYFPERFGIAEVTEFRIPTSNETPAALLDEVASRADLAIVGLAN
jgi:hypothetical protein